MALDIFIKFDGITGETTQEGKVKGAVQVLAWSWGMSSSSTFSPGSSGFSAGKPSIQDLSFTKFTDNTTALLQSKLLFGTVIKKAELFMLKQTGTDKAARDPYVHVTFEDVFLTSLSMGGSGGEDRTTENVTIGFRKFSFDYLQADPTDQMKLKIAGQAAYDLAVQK